MRARQRVFISSPADVQSAREVAAQTVERLAHEYARFFVVEPFLWENEVMVASGHFQDSIELPSEFDIVTLILWSRLGTMLPEKTAVREYRGMDGRTPVTGSEWEFETALAAARERGSPAILVYRSREPARIAGWDSGERHEQLEQLAALDRFWARHFKNDSTYLGAYSEFASLEQFSKIFEMHVRQLLQKKIEAAGEKQSERPDRLWPHSPFRGLEAYEYEHAAIYFGQDDAIGRALLQLGTNAKNGAAFLLLLGASGAGKSSLAKAGIVPRLFMPRRVSGAAFVRRVVFRPSDMAEGEDLFAAFARRLVATAGECQGLPEIVGPGQSAAELATFLRECTSNHCFPFSTALDRLALRLREDGRMLNYEAAKLVLVIDQLEELFTIDAISAEQRQRFIAMIAGLARSGHVWVVATMRSDFWHRASELPELMSLCEGSGRLDLMPPTTTQIGQMIRQPAEAAGISFERRAETDNAHGTSLNETILDEVAREPGVLPLLSYLLDQLYRSDILEAQGSTLTFGTYDRLHGLRGAIAARAEAILVAQAPEVRLSLRRLLFSLVQISVSERGAQQITARRAPLSAFPQGSPVRRLLDAFVDPAARLIVAEGGSSQEPTYRVAHEALLVEWGLARELLAESAGDLKTRRMIEERYERWRELSSVPRRARAILARWNPYSETGLLADSDLTDAKRLLSAHHEGLSQNLAEFVARSSAAARRKRNFTIEALAAVVGVLSVLTVTAVVSAINAANSERHARTYSDLVKASLNMAHKELLRAEKRGDDFTLGRTTIDPNDVAMDLFGFEIALATQMTRLEPGNLNWKHDLASGNARIGYALEQQHKFSRAIGYYRNSLAICLQLVAADPRNPDWKVDLRYVQQDLDRASQLAADATRRGAASPH